MNDPPTNRRSLDKLFDTVTWQRIVVGALIFLVFSVAYQACTSNPERSYKPPTTINILDDSEQPGKYLRLRVAYPETISIVGSNNSHLPVSVWLWSTEPLTPSTQVTYTVAFSTSSNLIFLSDDKGNPAAEVELAVSEKRGKPAVIYLQQRSSEFCPCFRTVNLDVQVVHPIHPDELLPGAISIPIEVWSRGIIFLFHFFNGLFGPTLTLASSAVIVIGIGVQQVLQRREKLAEKEIDQREAERKEKEQRERQKLEQKLQEIDRVRKLLLEARDIGKAVRRWWDYIRWASLTDKEGKSDWQHPEIQHKLNQLFDEIKGQEWQLAILVEAIGLFSNGQNKQAIERARLIHEIDSADRSLAAIAAQLLIAYVEEEKQHQISNIAQQVGATRVVEAIWWLYNDCKDGELGPIVKPVVVRTLAELVGQTDTIAEAYKVLNNGGQHLLQEPEFGEVLHRFLTEVDEPHLLDLAHELQDKRQEKYRWPPLWPRWIKELRTGDEAIVLEWLREISGADFTYNPFESKKAELDPNFTNYFVYPPLPDRQITSRHSIRPAILFAGQGSGKTSAALILADKCQNLVRTLPEEKIFPVYYPIKTTTFSDASCFFYLDIIAKILGKYLLEFLTYNPYSFLYHNDNQKYAIAYLLTYIAGSTQSLEILLNQTRLSNDNAGRHLLKQLLEKSRNIPDEFVATTEMIFEMLQYARPYGFTYTYILLDISTVSKVKSSKVKPTEQLSPLLDLMLPLAKANVFLKLFLSIALKGDLYIPNGITSDIIIWTPEKLKKLLEGRLSAAQSQSQCRIGNFDALFDPDAIESNPTEMLIAASQNSPARLIILIDQLLKFQAKHNSFSRIDYATLETILKAVNDENNE